MLVSTSSTRFAPHLHLNTRLVLAVGGYQTSLKSTDDGPALLAWLQGRLEVPFLPLHFSAVNIQFSKRSSCYKVYIQVAIDKLWDHG